MKAAMKRIYELSESGKLIYKAALEGKELSIIACMHMFNLVAVIPGSANRTVTTTEAPNVVEKDKEEHSDIMVSDVESSPEDAHFDYESADKGLDQDIKEDIQGDIEEDIEEKIRSLAIATAEKLTPSKTKATTLVEKDSVRRRLFTDSGRKMDNVSGVTSGTRRDSRGEKRKR